MNIDKSNIFFLVKHNFNTYGSKSTDGCLFYAFYDDERRPPTARDEEQSQCNGQVTSVSVRLMTMYSNAQQFQFFGGRGVIWT